MFNKFKKNSKEVVKTPVNKGYSDRVVKAKKETPATNPPRSWSNRELEKIAHLFSGDVVNVSGWQDKDKEGRQYKDYFTNKDSYTVTNYSPSHIQEDVNEVLLDLEKDLPQELANKFDVVLSHTNLEHIFYVFKAFENHCKMTKDIVIVVVPFIQQQHETEDYFDYWRFTPTCLRKLFEINGLETIYEAFSNAPHEINYLFFVGSKNPEKWKGKMPKYDKLYQICNWVG